MGGVETGSCGEYNGCNALSEPQPRILGKQLVGVLEMYCFRGRVYCILISWAFALCILTFAVGISNLYVYLHLKVFLLTS